MTMYTPIKQGMFILAFSLFLFSCSDNSSSADEENEPPAIPSLETIQPDLSYFTDNNPLKQSSYTNFNEGKMVAIALGNISAYAQAYAGYWAGISGMDADYKDGRWVWEYSYSSGSESVQLILTSRETGSEFLWDVTWSIQSPELTITDYTIIEGRTSKDGNRGSWTFNSMDESLSSEIPLITSTWNRESDTKITIETQFFGDGGALEGQFNYMENGSSFQLTGTGSGFGDNLNIVWNTDSMTGYYEIDGERKCWDSNFADVACS